MVQWGPGGIQVVREYDWETTRPSAAVVETIAEKRDVSPSNLDFTLQDHVDPDALDRVVPGGEDVVVSFPVEDVYVQVDEVGVAVSED